jgi:predicted metal-dependent hydrolase
MKIKIDQLIRSKRKSIALIVQRDGKLIVRAPVRLSEARITQFINTKSDWILTRQKKAASQQTPLREYMDGETFLFLGRKIPLKLVDHQDVPLKMDANFLLKRSQHKQAAQLFTRWYQKQARQVFTNRVEFFAQKNGFSYARIRLSSARTRWGSCSSKGTLSFTWRLVMAPPEVIDYVVLHELVHLQIKDHSAAFWARVQEYMPDFKKKRAWLKTNGYLLEIGNKL